MAVVAITVGVGVTAAGKNSFLPTLKFENNLFAKRTRTIEFAPDNTYSETELESGIPEGKIKLKYKETTEITGVDKFDVYCDDRENQYQYDSSGMLKCYTMNDLDRNLNSQNAKADLTENEARELAFKYAQQIFGDRVDGYEYEWTTEQEEMHKYTFGFIKRYGYARGSYCFVEVSTEGLLLKCNIVNDDKFDDFDISKLEKIPEEELIEFAGEQAKLQYGDELNTYEVRSIYLEAVDDKYNLCVSVVVDFGTGSDNFKTMEEYKYPLD